MNDEILSQDEINALLDSDEADEDQEGEDNDQTETAEVEADSDPEVELTEEEKDAIGEVGNISMGSAATALYSLLDAPVEITAPEVYLTTFNELINNYERPCVLVDVEYIEGLEGINILIIQEKDAAIISDLMMGGDGSDPDEELSELHLSAIGEAMNQMMGSASTSMSDVMQGDKVNISPPNTELLTLNSEEIKGRSIDPEETIVKVSFNLSIGDLIDSEIIQLMPADFAKELVDYITDPAAADETEESDTVQEATETEKKTAAQDRSEQAQMDKQPQRQPQQGQGQQVAQGQQQAAQGQQQTAKRQAAAQMQQQMEASKSGAVSSEESVDVQSVQFSQLGAGEQEEMVNNISLIRDIPLEVTVRLGKTKMLIKDILELSNGSVIELDKLAGESVDLLVNGKLVAKGEVVVIDENFGFRVTDIVSPMERINSL